MGTSRPKISVQKVEAFALAAEIQDVLRGADASAAMSALNYCMACMIHDNMHGTEEALALSDEQTRYVASILRTGETHH